MRVLSNLGIVEERLGDLTASAAWHREALALSERFEDRFGQAAALTNLGNLQQALGNPRRRSIATVKRSRSPRKQAMRTNTHVPRRQWSESAPAPKQDECVGLTAASLSFFEAQSRRGR